MSNWNVAVPSFSGYSSSNMSTKNTDMDARLDPLFGKEAQSVAGLDAAAPAATFSGANWEIEGNDISDASAATMHQAINMQGGGLDASSMAAYVEDSNASDFDTDLTSMQALLRNARYADQVGTM
jgi:hypothetical protein